MGKLWEKECGECKHIDLESKTSWGFPCAKTQERKEEFNKHKYQDGIYNFIFSPDPWVRSGWEACVFFEKKE